MKDNGTSEAEKLLRSYAVYKQQFFAETYAKTFFDSYGTFKALGAEDPREKMELIESLVASFAPSNMATLLNLHYINGLSIEQCAECMLIARSSAYRLLDKAHLAVNNRYQRMKGAPMKKTELCERCAFYDEDRDNQPCCSCEGQNFEEGAENET